MLERLIGKQVVVASPFLTPDAKATLLEVGVIGIWVHIARESVQTFLPWKSVSYIESSPELTQDHG